MSRIAKARVQRAGTTKRAASLKNVSDECRKIIDYKMRKTFGNDVTGIALGTQKQRNALHKTKRRVFVKKYRMYDLIRNV